MRLSRHCSPNSGVMRSITSKLWSRTRASGSFGAACTFMFWLSR